LGTAQGHFSLLIPGPQPATILLSSSSERVRTTRCSEEEDKMVERWRKVANGIFIFVSSHTGIYISVHINWNTIDWPILYRGRCCYHPGPDAEQSKSGYLSILPWEHLSGSRRPEHNTLIHFLPCRQNIFILSFKACRLMF
jgi:hypothetical protein